VAEAGIQLSTVGMTFGAGGVAALAHVDLRLEHGVITALVGPSGCGKTTVLKLIGGLIQPTAGSVRVDGLPADEARRRRFFSYAFQNPVLLPWLDVLDNVRLLAKMIARPEERRAEELLAAMGLAGFEHRFPGQLSGGMRQRASLARALTLAPRYLLLDEPFAALDDLTREVLDDLLARTWEMARFGCVLVTHNLNEAVYLADDIVVMSARPGTVRTRVRVDLPRPRDPGCRLSSQFIDKLRQVREALA